LSEAKGKNREGGLGDFSVRKNTTSQAAPVTRLKRRKVLAESSKMFGLIVLS